MEVEIAFDFVPQLLDLDALPRYARSRRHGRRRVPEDELDRVRSGVRVGRTGGSSPISSNACGRSVVVAPACRTRGFPLLRPDLRGARARKVNFATLASACAAPTVAMDANVDAVAVIRSWPSDLLPVIRRYDKSWPMTTG